MSEIKGADISFYQGNPQDGLFVDFNKMKAYGVDFVIIRAGQHNWIDPAFEYNWKEAKRVGIPRASYFFLDKDGSGKTQAEFYWSIMQNDPGEGPLIVDFESGSGYWEHHLEDFLVRLTELSGYPTERIWIYTGKYYWQDYGPRTQAENEWFLRHPLWLAKYSSFLDVREDVPYPWPKPVLWQRGTTIVYGPDLGVLSLELDWNRFLGTEEEFKKYWIVGDVIPDDPNEGGNELMKYKVVWSRGVARRTAPHIGTPTQNTYTGLIYGYPAEVEVIEDNIPDALDPTNLNKTWVKFSDGYYGASNYPDSMGVPRVRMEKVVEPEPEPTDPQVTHTIDIYDSGEISVDGGDRF